MNLPRRRITYLARAGEQPVAALFFPGSAPKIEVQDRKLCFLDDPAHPIPTASSTSHVRGNTLKLQQPDPTPALFLWALSPRRDKHDSVIAFDSPGGRFWGTLRSLRDDQDPAGKQ